jgi:hypothetical protein
MHFLFMDEEASSIPHVFTAPESCPDSMESIQDTEATTWRKAQPAIKKNGGPAKLRSAELPHTRYNIGLIFLQDADH